MSTLRLEPLYYICDPDNSFTDAVCETHAVIWAKENNLVWHDDFAHNYTLSSGWSEKYAYVEPFTETYSDRPLTCESCCRESDGEVATYLSHGMTPEGSEYLLDPDNDFPEDVKIFYLGTFWRELVTK